MTDNPAKMKTSLKDNRKYFLLSFWFLNRHTCWCPHPISRSSLTSSSLTENTGEGTLKYKAVVRFVTGEVGKSCSNGASQRGGKMQYVGVY